MTPEQIALVKKSWKIFRDIDPVLIGDVFYSKLFIEVPQVRHLFKTSRAIQSRKLIDMLNTIVGRLDRLDELTTDIEQLAIRHVQYGARPEHYQAIGHTLIWTLKQGLGADWTREVEDAWMSCYQRLSHTMIKAANYKGQSA
ncbi:MAG TPA: globin domain-containing protein [Chitinophagaceae bacterium]|nr:globin domain-containing protein [Chitinophagaceae bacterium]